MSRKLKSTEVAQLEQHQATFPADDAAFMGILLKGQENHEQILNKQQSSLSTVNQMWSAFWSVATDELFRSGRTQDERAKGSCKKSQEEIDQIWDDFACGVGLDDFKDYEDFVVVLNDKLNYAWIYFSYVCILGDPHLALFLAKKSEVEHSDLGEALSREVSNLGMLLLEIYKRITEQGTSMNEFLFNTQD
jgi:hypothetical protein